jgi:hypothetical protein
MTQKSTDTAFPLFTHRLSRDLCATLYLCCSVQGHAFRRHDHLVHETQKTVGPWPQWQAIALIVTVTYLLLNYLWLSIDKSNPLETKINLHYIYRAYTKEWCGFNSEYYLNRTILLCMPCTLGRSQWPHGLRRWSAAACWDFGFESHRGHGCLSLVSVVCCQVEVSVTGWSLLQRSPIDCGVWVWSWSLDNEEALAH